MFEDADGVVARVTAHAPTEAELADPDHPLPERMSVLVDELVAAQRAVAAAEGRSRVLMAELCKWAEAWQHRHDRQMVDGVGPEDLVAAEIAPALQLAPVTAA